MPGGERHLEVVCQFVDEDAVADKNRRLHGTGRHIIPVGERGADGEEYQRQDEQGTDFLPPPMAGTGMEGCQVHWKFDQEAVGSFSRINREIRQTREKEFNENL